MSVTENKTNTLRAQEHGHQPIVYTLKIRGGETWTVKDIQPERDR